MRSPNRSQGDVIFSSHDLNVNCNAFIGVFVDADLLDNRSEVPLVEDLLNRLQNKFRLNMSLLQRF